MSHPTQPPQSSSQTLTLDCQGATPDGRATLRGQLVVEQAAARVEEGAGAGAAAAHLAADRQRFAQLFQRSQGLPAVRTAVVHPCSETALLGAIEAAQAGLILPVLVGPPARIAAVAERCGVDLAGIEQVATAHSHAAAAEAVRLAREGAVEALMKGSLHTDELLSAVVDAGSGLRTERRASHVFLADVPSYPKPLLITDAAINIDPDLATKADMVRNAIDLAHLLGIAEPKVAILAAVETVTPKMRATLDAAALCKMADRGQIRGGLLDGPLAFDNAISPESARTKGIVSRVAGEADVLVLPDLESGNMVAKQLEYLAGALLAGVVTGARVPLVVTSRADTAPARIASCALAQLMVHRRQPGAPSAAALSASAL